MALSSGGDLSALATETVLRGGLAEAARAFSQFVQQNVDLSDPLLAHDEPVRIPALLGEPGQQVAAVFLAVEGDLDGYLLLLIPEHAVECLLTWMLGDPDVDSELAQSAIGEIGNVVGSAFLNYLADIAEIRISPAPPQVVHETVAAVLGTIAAGLEATGYREVQVVCTELVGIEGSFSVYFIWLPRLSSAPQVGA